MKQKEAFSARQLRALFTVALLSPALRLIPGSAAALAGRPAWASPLAALPALLLYAGVLHKLSSALRPGETLPQLALRALGQRLGRAVLLLLGGWLLLYAGFVLRAGADRFQVTVYPRTGPAFFVVTMGLLVLFAALGRMRSLVRVARMTEPVLLLTLLLILLAALRSLDLTELLPVTVMDAGSLLYGALPAVDLLSFGLAMPLFFAADKSRPTASFGASALWLGGGALLLVALGAAVEGHFGAALSTRLSAPFFALVRNLVFFRSLERLEALVVGLWIFPDFLLAALSLQAGQRCLRLAMGKVPGPGERRLSMANGRWIIWLSGGAVLALGLGIAPNPALLLRWSRSWIPAGSMILSLLLIPGLLLAAGAQKKQ